MSQLISGLFSTVQHCSFLCALLHAHMHTFSKIWIFIRNAEWSVVLCKPVSFFVLLHPAFPSVLHNLRKWTRTCLGARVFEYGPDIFWGITYIGLCAPLPLMDCQLRVSDTPPRVSPNQECAPQNCHSHESVMPPPICYSSVMGWNPWMMPHSVTDCFVLAMNFYVGGKQLLAKSSSWIQQKKSRLDTENCANFFQTADSENFTECHIKKAEHLQEVCPSVTLSHQWQHLAMNSNEPLNKHKICPISKWSFSVAFWYGFQPERRQL